MSAYRGMSGYWNEYGKSATEGVKSAFLEVSSGLCPSNVHLKLHLECSDPELYINGQMFWTHQRLMIVRHLSCVVAKSVHLHTPVYWKMA